MVGLELSYMTPWPSVANGSMAMTWSSSKAVVSLVSKLGIVGGV